MTKKQLENLMKDLNEYLGKRHPIFKEKTLIVIVEKDKKTSIKFDNEVIYEYDGILFNWKSFLNYVNTNAIVMAALHDMSSDFFINVGIQKAEARYGLEK